MKSLVTAAVAAVSFMPVVCNAAAAMVPAWATPVFLRLEAEGIIAAPREKLKNMTRTEAAGYTVQALNFIENRSGVLARRNKNSAVRGTEYGNMMWVEIPHEVECERLVVEAKRFDVMYKTAYRNLVNDEYALALQSQRKMEKPVLVKNIEKRDKTAARLEALANERAALQIKLNNRIMFLKNGGQYNPAAPGAKPLGDGYGAAIRMCAADEARCRILNDEVKKAQADYTARKREYDSFTAAAGRPDGVEDKSTKGLADGLKQNTLVSNLKMAEQRLTLAESLLQKKLLLLENGRTHILEMEQSTLASADSVAKAPAAAAGTGTGSVKAGTTPGRAGTDSLIGSAGKLRAEFAPELAAMGYFDDENARQVALTERKPAESAAERARVKLDGEVRLDNGEHHGPAADSSRTRARVRLYPDINIDGNWHAKGMVEYEKTFRGKGYSNDGKVRLDRYYLEGCLGKTLIDAGKFGSMMAEGNIYDGSFRGVRAVYGDKLQVRAEAGKTANVWFGDWMTRYKAFNVVVAYNAGNSLWEAGYYRFYNRNESNNIFMLNYHQKIGKYDLGLMYLPVRKGGNGFVGTLRFGREMPWRKGAMSWFVKYYRQPRESYLMHTMNGLADRMQGFSGPAVGVAYSLEKNLQLNVEYYWLRDLITREHNNTFWVALTYFFNTYDNE